MLRLEHAKVAGAYLTVVPDVLNGTTIQAEEFRDNLRIYFGLQPQGLRQTCNRCGKNLMVDHALHLKKGDLVTIYHNYVEDECGNLYIAAPTPSAVAHTPLINHGGQSTVTGASAADMDDKGM